MKFAFQSKKREIQSQLYSQAMLKSIANKQERRKKRPKKWERKKMDPEVYLEKEDSIDEPLCNELANLSTY